MMGLDDLVNRLRFGSLTHIGASKMNLEAADRIEELESDVKAVLRREHDANKKAFEHLRRAEKFEIASKNYAAFNHEWRSRAEAAEAKLARAVLQLHVIANWREGCHEYDQECGHELREFGEDDVMIIERLSNATLAELKGQTDE